MPLSQRMDKENVLHLHNGTIVYIIQWLKNNDILKLACKWIELEKSILSEITQTQKEKHGMYLLILAY